MEVVIFLQVGFVLVFNKFTIAWFHFYSTSKTQQIVTLPVSMNILTVVNGTRHSSIVNTYPNGVLSYTNTDIVIYSRNNNEYRGVVGDFILIGF